MEQVRDGRNRKTFHTAAVADVAALMTECAATASHFERARLEAIAQQEAGGRVETRRKVPVSGARMPPKPRSTAAMADGVRLSPLDTLGGLPHATRALVRVLSHEVEYQAAKVKYVLGLLDARDEAEACVQEDLACAQDTAYLSQLVVDTMAQRPRLDLAALSCEPCYAGATHAMKIRATLLRRVLGHHSLAVEQRIKQLQHFREGGSTRRERNNKGWVSTAQVRAARGGRATTTSAPSAPRACVRARLRRRGGLVGDEEPGGRGRGT
eukprot:311983-Prymnesium_polylepis.1